LRAFGAVRLGESICALADPGRGKAWSSLPCPCGKLRPLSPWPRVAAVFAAPAAADGQRGSRSRSGAWPVGAITANVITPDYYGYYGGFYSYNGRNYYPGPVSCWRERYRLWVCW
jgi:hypothetical protein